MEIGLFHFIAKFLDVFVNLVLRKVDVSTAERAFNRKGFAKRRSLQSLVHGASAPITINLHASHPLDLMKNVIEEPSEIL